MSGFLFFLLQALFNNARFLRRRSMFSTYYLYHFLLRDTYFQVVHYLEPCGYPASLKPRYHFPTLLFAISREVRAMQIL